MKMKAYKYETFDEYMFRMLIEEESHLKNPGRNELHHLFLMAAIPGLGVLVYLVIVIMYLGDRKKYLVTGEGKEVKKK